MSEAIRRAIKAPVIQPYRRLFIKRKVLSTGLFESDWTEVTDDVIKWGVVQASSDQYRIGKFKFGGIQMVMSNDEGRYNDEESENSLWYQYRGQQRTMVKIEAGFEHFELGTDGIWTISKTGLVETTAGVYDSTQGAYNTTYKPVFTGVISGDMMVNDSNRVTMPIKPLVEVLRQYPASKLNDYTSSGMTASQFVEMVRDHTDGAGQYVFRPFFGDTTSYWEISSTSIVYADLNTQSSDNIAGKSVWNVIEKLAEAEQHLAYTTADGRFKFVSVDAIVTTPVYQFHGLNSYDRDYGPTIKTVRSYGKRHSKYYSRVEVKWSTDETFTSYGFAETELQVAALNEPWENGARILSIENLWVPNQTVANSIASKIHNNLQTSKYEIEFTTTFVPHLEVLDRISITYDTEPSPNSYELWGVGFWAADEFAVSSLSETTATTANKLINNVTGRRLSQPFTTTADTSYLYSFKLGLWKVSAANTFGGYLLATLHKDNGSGAPTSTAIATSATLPVAGVIPAASITSMNECLEFTFAEPYQAMDPSTRYHLVVSFDAVNFTGGSIYSGFSNFTTNVFYVSNNSGTSWSTSFAYSLVYQLNVGNGDDETPFDGTEARWSGSKGQAIVLDDEEFKVLSIAVDLDQFQTTIVAREV